ncbi:MAG: 30S ribosome-binding factor RbfA, partial [Corallococcus sp.]|nr:30S ribosome-binding factor RbfA [Corallococcus sp.]
NRVNKLNAEFKRYIAELLTKKVKDPRITEMFTILEVDCDKELSSAKVYVSIFSVNPDKAAQTFLAIRESEPLIRREISKNMRIRKAPEFNFILDASMAYGQKINEILNEIKTKDDD